MGITRSTSDHVISLLEVLRWFLIPQKLKPKHLKLSADTLISYFTEQIGAIRREFSFSHFNYTPGCICAIGSAFSCAFMRELPTLLSKASIPTCTLDPSRTLLYQSFPFFSTPSTSPSLWDHSHHKQTYFWHYKKKILCRLWSPLVLALFLLKENLLSCLCSLSLILHFPFFP